MDQICDDILLIILTDAYIKDPKVQLPMVCSRWKKLLYPHREHLLNKRVDILTSKHSVRNHEKLFNLYKIILLRGGAVPQQFKLAIECEREMGEIIIPPPMIKKLTKKGGLHYTMLDTTRACRKSYRLCKHGGGNQFIKRLDKYVQSSPTKAKIARNGLFGACKGGHKELALEIINHYSLTINAVTMSSHYACQGGHVDLARYLFSYKKRRPLNETFFLDACNSCNLALMEETLCLSRLNYAIGIAMEKGSIDMLDFCLYHKCANGLTVDYTNLFNAAIWGKNIILASYFINCFKVPLYIAHTADVDKYVHKMDECGPYYRQPIDVYLYYIT